MLSFFTFFLSGNICNRSPVEFDSGRSLNGVLASFGKGFTAYIATTKHQRFGYLTSVLRSSINIYFGFKPRNRLELAFGLI